MSPGIPPASVPLCNTRDEHSELCREAEENQDAFVVIHERDIGYSVWYDLASTGHRLTDEATEELRERVTREIETIQTDAEPSIVGLGFDVGDTFGNACFFERERTAREFASTVSRTVLDEDNWEEALSPREAALEEAGLGDDA